MKINQALPSNYLAKEDFEQPVLATVKSVGMEMVKDPNGPDRSKPVMYLANASDRNLDTARGIILNKTNWNLLSMICQSDDSDDWIGREIVVFNEPSVTFGADVVGGIRVRRPQQQAEPTPAAATDEPVSVGADNQPPVDERQPGEEPEPAF